MKKIISIILSLILIMSVVPMGIFTLTASATYYESHTIIAQKGKDNTFESAHPYSNNCDISWEYIHYAETDELLVTFSPDTCTEDCDEIYIYEYNKSNGNYSYFGEYAGSSLAGRTITIPGNRFKIRLTTDGSVTYYGFKITEITVPCEHVYDSDSDFYCNLCDKPRPHTCEYDNDFDDICNLCQYQRYITGNTVEYQGVYYEINSSGTLDVTGCNYEYRYDDYYDDSRRYVDELIIQPSVYGRAVTGISNDAFGNWWRQGDYNTSYGSYVIDKVVIPEGVKSIATYAFKNATIKDLYIPSSILVMYEAAFKYAYITNVYTPDLTAWCGMTFGYESSNPLHSATNFFVNNVLVNDLVIPNDVEVINDYAFCNFESFTSVTIPSNVKVINESAFVSCYGITSVNLSEGLEEIKTGAFANCSGITELTIPASLKTIGECAFCSCTGLEDIIILYDESSNNSLYIDCEAFAGATNITDIWCTATKSQTNITIADNSEELLNANWHYGTCDAADHVYDDDCDAKCNNCDWIRDDAHIYTDILDSSCNACGDTREVSNEFYEGNFKYYAEKVWDYNDENYHIELTLKDTKNLPVGEVVIPSNVKGCNVTAIGSSAFYDCCYITSIVIPDTVTYIGSYAFEDCYNLKSVTIGKGVNYIANSAFFGCNSLENVYISDLKAWCEMYVNDSYSSSNPLYYASKLYLNGELITDLVIPEGTESIRYEAFKNLKHIESVTLPASLQTIYGSAFIGCTGIKTVNMKDGISSIGHRAFYNCTSLTDVYYNGLETDIDDINIGTQNGQLNAAQWHFVSCNGAEHTYDNSCDNICNVCGSARNVKHTWNKGVVNKAATCLAEGSKTFTCTTCGTTKTEKLLKTQTHNFGDWNADKEPTCIDFGKETRTCKDCKKSEIRSISPTGHAYSNACDKTCNNNCGTTRSISHSWKSATCTAPKTCRICKKTTGKALGHKYTNDCDENCNTCGATRKITHNYKATTTKATLSKDGKTVNKCSICGNTKTTVIKYAKTFTLSATSYTYDGKVKKPSVVIKDSAGKTISSSNYTVTYASGRKNVGSYTVKVTMKGNYKGTKTFTFKINPAKTTLSKVTPATKKLTVTYTKKTTQVTGYEIQYSTSSKFTSSTTKTKTVTKNTTTSASITGLKAKTTYYVRVRTYKTVGKTKYYSGWTTVKYAKTK